MDFRNFDGHPLRIGHWSMAFFGMEAPNTCKAFSSDRGPSRTWSYREIIELSCTGAFTIRPSKQKVGKYHFVGQKLWQCLISSQGSFSCLRLCAVRLSFCWRSSGAACMCFGIVFSSSRLLRLCFNWGKTWHGPPTAAKNGV